MKRIEDVLFLNKQILENDYIKLGSLRKIAEKYNTCHGTIKRAFKRLNINYKSYNYKIINCDECFFEQLNNTSLYWLGFLMADGCVHKNTIRLSLSIKDIDHVKKFKNDIKSDVKISIVKNFLNKKNKKWKDVDVVSFGLTSKKIVNDVKKFGLIPNKTFKTKFVNAIKRHPNVHIFCRGYFDGDGCWHLHNPKSRPNHKAQLVFALRGTKDFLIDFNNIMILKGILPNICLNKKINMSSNIGQLTYNGNNICSDIAKWLYQDILKGQQNNYLKRKFDIVKDKLNI